MNPEIKGRWLEALRSGRYAQGKNYLRTADNKYCCLGVLCELVNPDGWMERSPHNPHSYAHGFFACNGYPSEGILEQAELDHETKQHLANMNDTGSTFEEIARHIEENL